LKLVITDVVDLLIGDIATTGKADLVDQLTDAPMFVKHRSEGLVADGASLSEEGRRRSRGAM
jgi:hypothetical protein